MLAPGHIPWGHLNLVDLGAGGYRTIAPDARPLSCGDLHEGASVETEARRLPQRHDPHRGALRRETDTIFPCMAVTNMEAGVGDSGGAVLLDGQPAGIAARASGQAASPRLVRDSPTWG